MKQAFRQHKNLQACALKRGANSHLWARAFRESAHYVALRMQNGKFTPLPAPECGGVGITVRCGEERIAFNWGRRTYRGLMPNWIRDGKEDDALDFMLGFIEDGIPKAAGAAIREVADLLLDLDSKVSQGAAHIINEAAQKENLVQYEEGIIRKLEGALGSQNHIVIMHSAEALGALADSHKVRMPGRTIDSMIMLLSHPDEGVREEGSRCLLKISKNDLRVVDKLEALLRDDARIEFMSGWIMDVMRAEVNEGFPLAHSLNENASLILQALLVPDTAKEIVAEAIHDTLDTAKRGRSK